MAGLSAACAVRTVPLDSVLGSCISTVMVSEVPGKQLLLGSVCRETQVRESPADTGLNPVTLSADKSSDIS